MKKLAYLICSLFVVIIFASCSNKDKSDYTNDPDQSRIIMTDKKLPVVIIEIDGNEYLVNTKGGILALPPKN